MPAWIAAIVAVFNALWNVFHPQKVQAAKEGLSGETQGATLAAADTVVIDQTSHQLTDVEKADVARDNADLRAALDPGSLRTPDPNSRD